jgi:hypothetical protein
MKTTLIVFQIPKYRAIVKHKFKKITEYSRQSVLGKAACQQALSVAEGARIYTTYERQAMRWAYCFPPDLLMMPVSR